MRLILGALPLIVLLLFLCSSRLSTSVTMGHPEPLDDLPTFVAASSAIRAGENPYDVANIQRHLPDSSMKAYPYVYTPVLAQILSLVSIHSYWDLQDVWMVVSAVLLSFWLVYTVKMSGVLIRQARGYQQEHPTIEEMQLFRRWQPFLLLGAACVLPLSYLMLNGQLEPLLLPLLTIAIILVLQGRHTAAGILIGSVLVIKHAALFLVIWLLIRRSWKTLGWMSVTGCSSIILSIMLFGIEPWQQFFASVLRHTSTAVEDMGIPLYDGYNLSFVGMVTRLGLEHSALITVVGVLLCVSVCVCLLWIQLRRERSRPMEEIMILALAFFLVLPYFWTYHLMYVAAPTIAICAQMIMKPVIRTKNRMIALISMTIAFVVAPGTLLWKVTSRLGLDVPADISGTITTILLIVSMFFFCRSLYEQPQRTQHAGVV